MGLRGKGWADVTVLKAGVRRLRLKCDGTSAETRFRLSAKSTSPFKSAGASVQSTAGSRGVLISVSNAGYTTLRGRMRVLATHSIPQFPLQFPSRASPCVNTFQRDSTYTRVFPATVVTAIQFCQLNIYAHELQRSRDLVAVIVTTFCVGDSGIAVWLPADASVSRAHSVSKWTGNAGSSPEI